MPAVTVANLKSGMKLSRPIVNDSGMVLLPQGTVLTDSLIGRIENMNIATVSIEGSQEPQKPLEEVMAEIDARFRNADDQPLMQMLKRIMKEHAEVMYK